jgi:hypothetical protein
MIHNTKHSGYALNYNGTVFTRQKRRQLGGSIFSAIFSGLKSLIAPLFGSLTKATVKQAAISGGKELLKSAGKAALEEGGKALGSFATTKLNDVINSKPVQKIAEIIPQAQPILRKIPKVIDQKLIDSEVQKLRERLSSMADDIDSGSGLKRGKGKKKIMDYI